MRYVAVLALLAFGCSEHLPVDPSPEGAVTPLPPLPGDCLCTCRFQPNCPLLYTFEILEEIADRQDEFEVSIDVRDYRMMPWSRWPEDPVSYLTLKFTYDPAKLELMEMFRGLDTEDANNWWWAIEHNGPWGNDPSLNLVVLVFSEIGGKPLTDPVLPPVYLPEYGQAYKLYRPARFRFRRVGVGDTALIFREWCIWQHHYSSVKVFDPLYLRLTPNGPRVIGGLAP